MVTEIQILIDNIDFSLGELKVESHKFIHKGNVSAGKRMRKHLQDIKKQSQELRIMIQSKIKEG